MINGLFKEISEEEMMCVNGGCGGGLHGPTNNETKCSRCSTAQDIIYATEAQLEGPQDNSPTQQAANLATVVINLIAHAVKNNCEKNGHK